MAYSAFKFEVHGDVRSVSCLFDASMQDSNLRLQNLGTAPLVLQVQGVNFRSGAVDHANKVGVVGHVENTSSGTVTGEVQGEKTPVSQMKDWLQNTGPTGAKIDKCNISNERNDLDKLSFSSFEKH